VFLSRTSSLTLSLSGQSTRSEQCATMSWRLDIPAPPTNTRSLVHRSSGATTRFSCGRSPGRRLAPAHAGLLEQTRQINPPIFLLRSEDYLGILLLMLNQENPTKPTPTSDSWKIFSTRTLRSLSRRRFFFSGLPPGRPAGGAARRRKPPRTPVASCWLRPTPGCKRQPGAPPPQPPVGILFFTSSQWGFPCVIVSPVGAAHRARGVWR